MNNSPQRILLISPKDSYLLGSPPLGVGYLIAYSSKVGQNEVFFHDENFLAQADLDSEIKVAIEKYQPTMVALAFPSSAIKRVIAISTLIKEKNPEIIIFGGGYHPSSEPEATLRLIPSLDFIIVDQAEYAFAHLNEQWKLQNSVAYLNDNEKFVQNQICNPIEGLDSIPYINRTIYDPRYFQPNYVISGIYGKTATIMSSRGCPYRCAFCSNELLQKNVNFHSVDYVLGEIESILSQVGKIDYLYFLDVMFLTRWPRTKELCEALIRSKILKNIKWAATVSSNVITMEKVKLMKEAGCFYLSFGLESNSANSLKLMNKVAKPHHNENAIEICETLGVLYNSAFLFGIPDEEEADLQATVDLVKKYNVFATGVNMMKPLPGSPYYSQFVNEGKIKKTIDDWHIISSIHHDSGYFNDRISPEVYERYKMDFYKAVRFKTRFNHYRANLPNLVKYSIPGMR